MNILPYKCTWPRCTHASVSKCCITTHVRSIHLGVPRHLKDQMALNGELDPRDVNQWVRVDDTREEEVMVAKQMLQEMGKGDEGEEEVNLDLDDPDQVNEGQDTLEETTEQTIEVIFLDTDEDDGEELYDEEEGTCADHTMCE